MHVTFQLEGQKFIVLNGGPQFRFTDAISFFVNCKTQAEVDDLWEKLAAGVKSKDAAGSKTNSGYPGRSFLQFWAKCCKIRNLKNREEL
jgi:3-demethylubiquinone-9 3-methyltransferase